MAGTRAGALKATESNLKNDPDFYKRIARLGNEAWKKNGRKPRGFSLDREKARLAGQKGGKASKRKKQPLNEE